MAFENNINNRLSVPDAGQAVTLEVHAGERIAFDFTPETTNMDISQTGDSLQITFDNGGTITLQGFFEFLNDESAASIALPGSDVISAIDFLNIFAPDLAPAGGEARAGGLNVYADSAGDMIGGLDALDDQEGFRWNYQNRQEETYQPGIVATGGTPPVPGPVPSGSFGPYGLPTIPGHGTPQRLFNKGHVDVYFDLQNAAVANSFICTLSGFTAGWLLSQETLDFLAANNISHSYAENNGQGEYTFDFTGSTLTHIDISLEAPLSIFMDVSTFKSLLDSGTIDITDLDAMGTYTTGNAFTYLPGGLQASVIINGVAQNYQTEEIEVNSGMKYENGYNPTDPNDDHAGRLIIGQPGQSDDTLYSGKGSDLLYGGEGHDTFKWDANNFSANTADRILDFDLDTTGNSSDMLDFSGLFANAGGNVAQYNILYEFVSWNTSDYDPNSPTSLQKTGLKLTITNDDNYSQEIYLDDVDFANLQQAAVDSGNAGAAMWDPVANAQDALDFFYQTYIS